MKTKRESAYRRIRSAMVRAEREVRSYARRHGCVAFTILLGRRWSRALDRCVEKGLMRYDKRRGGYVTVRPRG